MRLFVVVFVAVCIPSFICLTSQEDNSRLNFFDIDLLKYATEHRAGNVAVSPISIKSILAMLMEGAVGDTAEEIRYALRLSPDKNEFREQFDQYLTALKARSKGAILEYANAAFIADYQKVKTNVEAILRNIYSTSIYKTNFKDPVTTALRINNWVNEATRGLIPVIVEPGAIDTSTSMMLTNALYFKSSWMYSFNPQLTKGACFYNHGDCKMVEMMDLNAELNYGYVDNLRAHALELPYEGGRYSMIILVPHERDGWPYIIRDLPYMSLPQIYKLMEKTDVQLNMPKFVVDYGEDMNKALENMRITTLFTPYANLSGILESKASHATTIHHKVRMSVDEVGTVAAASTAAVVVPLIHRGGQIKVDRPFVFFIRDNELGLVLFEGKIEEPTPYVPLRTSASSLYSSGGSKSQPEIVPTDLSGRNLATQPPPTTHKPSILKRIFG